MKRKKRISGVLLTLAALVIMQLPMAEADASTSASDFQIEGSTLKRYRGTDKNVSVPDTVQIIGNGAFEDDANIELVVMPNSVRQIESYAFWGCDNLDTVVLGKGLSEIGDYAFTKCTGLQQISVPSTVTSIGIEAFKDCANLTDVTIPPETVNIHETAFDGCVKLTIHYEEGSAAEEYAAAFYERQKEMPGYQKPSNSFWASIVQEIMATQTPEPEEPSPSEEPAEPEPLPAEPVGALLGSTQIVGNQAVVFMDNTRPQVFGAGAGAGSAQGTDSASSGEAGTDSTEGSGAQDGGIPKYRIVDGHTVADQAHYRNANLGDLTLADGIVEIGQFAFSRSSLTGIALPQGLEQIDYGAFYHCTQLGDVTLPDSVMCVEPKAFEHSLWVDGFLADGNPEDGEGSAETGDFLVSGGVLVAYRGNSKEVAVPEGVRVIAAEAFQGHEEIESVSFPDSLLVVGEGAFEGCTNLSQISFGKNVQEVKDRAFLGNTMQEISVPVSLEKVGLKAFGNAVIAYEGREAEYTYETSATRLANEAYRVYDGTDSGEPGVTVEGLDGASATLEEAARSYVLSVETPEDVSGMESAFQRSFRSGLPEDMVIYGLTLTDASGIPLTKLGSQALDVELPIPESLRGRKLQFVALDRNGQLEPLTAEQITLDGREFLRFRLGYVSTIGIWGIESENIIPNGNARVSESTVIPTETPAPMPTATPTK